jgi:hypothetical protein
MDSNLTWIGPPTLVAHPCLPPKVVANGEYVQGLPLCVLHLLGTCFILGQGPKGEKQAHGDDAAPDRNSDSMY